MFTRNDYGGDLRLLDSVLAATGFDSINFTPINISQIVSPPARKRRRIVYDDQVDQGQQFRCEICQQPFPLKKTRDRHQESVHKKQLFPCSTCNRSFNRKDIRNRHQAEKHSGRRRTRALTSVSSGSNAEDFAQANLQHSMQHHQEISGDGQEARDMPYSAHVTFNSADNSGDTDVADDDTNEADRVRIHDCLGSLGAIHTYAVSNPLLLCTNLLLRCKPYRRFFIHDRKRDLVYRQKWKPPNKRFCELYDLAIRTLRLRLASGTRDAELLAAIVAFVNVDVLINGSEVMGYHAQAMYSMKAHHLSRRHPILDALKAAFEHCGKTCRSVRIIYTKRGFVWMLNVRPSLLMLDMRLQLTFAPRWDIAACGYR